MQHRHDTDVAICEQFPIDEMPFITTDMAIHPEFRRNRTPRKAAFRNVRETLE